MMLITLIHDSYSAVKLVDAAKIAFILGTDLLVISRASSSAAQSGVPEVEKIAYKGNKRVLYVPDLKDAIELLSPDRIYMVVPKKLGKEKLDLRKLKSDLAKGLKVMIAVSGGHTSFSLKELEHGSPVYLEFLDENISPAGIIAIILYSLKSLV